MAKKINQLPSSSITDDKLLFVGSASNGQLFETSYKAAKDYFQQGLQPSFDTGSFALSSSFNSFTASIQGQVNNVFASESNYTLTSSFNAYTGSENARVTNVFASQSNYTPTSSFQALSSSYSVDSSSFNSRILAISGGLQNLTGSFSSFSSSYHNDSSSFNNRINSSSQGTVGGNGTNSYFTIFSGSSAITSSLVYQNSGSVVVSASLNLVPVTGIGNDLSPLFNVGHTSSILTSGGAATFTASLSQSLIVNSNSSLQGGSSNLTLCGWMKFHSLTGAPQVLASKDDNATQIGSEYYIGYYPPDGGFVWQTQVFGNTLPFVAIATFPIVPAVNTWYFLAGTWNFNTGVISLQVNNGAPVTQSVTGFAPINVTTCPFTIGSDLGGSFMNGEIQSVGLWKRILSASELSSMYVIKPPATPANNGINPGTFSNGTWSNDVPTQLSVNHSSSVFNGSNSVVSVVNGFPIPYVGGAASLWFKNTSFASETVLLGNSSNASAYIAIVDNSTIRFQTDSTVVNNLDFTVPPMTASVWYNLVVNRDNGGSTHVYLNGVQSSTGGQSSVAFPLTINQVGRYWDNSFPALTFNGKVSEVNLFTSSLSVTDISLLSSGSSSITNPGLYFKLNEGTGTVVKDYTSVGGVQFTDLSPALQNESPNTFISWWDLKETSGNRSDSRVPRPAPLNIASGSASSPNDGDIWFDGTNLKMRVGGVTKTFTLT